MANNSKIDFDKVNEYAKELGIGAKGKKRDGFINEVLDAIVSQYTEYEEKMDEKDFETYKKESQEMLQFYMANKDYGQETPAMVKEDEKAQEMAAEEAKELVVEETKEPEAKEESVVEEKAERKVKKVPEKKTGGKKVKEKAKEKKVNYTRSDALIASLAKRGSKKELIERANKLYIENGGSDKSQVAEALLGYVMPSLLILKVVKVDEDGIYNLVK